MANQIVLYRSYGQFEKRLRLFLEVVTLISVLIIFEDQIVPFFLPLECKITEDFKLDLRSLKVGVRRVKLNVLRKMPKAKCPCSGK